MLLSAAVIAVSVQRGLTGSDSPRSSAENDSPPLGYSEVGYGAAGIKDRTVYARTLDGHGFDGPHAPNKVATIAISDRVITADRERFQQMLARGGGSHLKTKDGKTIGLVTGSEVVYLDEKMDRSLILNRLDNCRRNAKNNPLAFHAQLTRSEVVVIPQGTALEVVDSQFIFLKVKYESELWWVDSQSVYCKYEHEGNARTAQ